MGVIATVPVLPGGAVNHKRAMIVRTGPAWDDSANTNGGAAQ